VIKNDKEVCSTLASETLKQLEFHVKEIVRLQKAEDAQADPPNFEENAKGWLDTKCLKDIEGLKILSAKDKTNQPFWELALKLFNEIGIDKPENSVERYPFKTDLGHLMSAHLKSIDELAYDLLNQFYENDSERLEVFTRLQEISRLITADFPEADIEQARESKGLYYRHYFVICAYGPFKSIPKIIARTDEERLFYRFFGPTIVKIRIKCLNLFLDAGKWKRKAIAQIKSR